MASNRPQYRCRACGQRSVRWLGRCPECRAWGSLDELPAAVPAGRGGGGGPPLALPDVPVAGLAHRPTGLGELDRVLGGGLVAGGVVLLAGEPGVGKSTLLLQLARGVAAPDRPVLVVSGEESAAQVRLRAERVGALCPHVYLTAESGLPAVLGHLGELRPALVVVDSIQTMSLADVPGPPGSLGQVRECAAVLTRAAKAAGTPLVLAGHVTKDGSVAGPRALEHLVDVVLTLDGDRHATLRLLRATKNRFGPTDEVGCFELTGGGLVELADPAGRFLHRRHGAQPVGGTCVGMSLEGRRPLPAEVQALVVDATGPPRRSVSGLEAARMAMLLAVLVRRARLPLAGADVYLSTVGGLRVTETALDLAVALAVASACADVPLPPDLVAVGEIGLAGDVRPVPGVGRRLAEAARLGFRRALVPAGTDVPVPDGVHMLPVADLAAGLRALRSVSGPAHLAAVR